MPNCPVIGIHQAPRSTSPKRRGADNKFCSLGSTRRGLFRGWVAIGARNYGRRRMPPVESNTTAAIFATRRPLWHKKKKEKKTGCFPSFNKMGGFDPKAKPASSLVLRSIVSTFQKQLGISFPQHSARTPQNELRLG